MQRTLCVFLVVAMTFSGTGGAYAALNDRLQEVFDAFGLANLSPAGVYNSQNRGYLVGGSLTARLQNTPVNLFSISPPRLAVGCSGIDLYLGSFSYGSLTRYVDLLTQLGTGVVLGFAFQLAIKTLCEPCADVLNKLESAARMVNSLGRVQPCQSGMAIGKALAGDAASQSKVMNEMGQSWQTTKEAWGAISDIWEDRDDAATKDTSEVVTDLKTNPLATADDDPTGNLVWKILLEAGVAIDDAVMIQSSIGTVIVNDDGEVQVRPPLIKFEDLIGVHIGQTIELWTCADGTGVDECLVLARTANNTISGFRERVFTQLTTILGKIYSKTPLTVAEQNFVNVVPTPVFSMLVKMPQPVELGQAFINRIDSLTAVAMAYHWLSWASEQVASQAYKMTYKKKNWVGEGAVTKWEEKARDVVTRAQRSYALVYQVYQGENGGLEEFYRAFVKDGGQLIPERSK